MSLASRDARVIGVRGCEDSCVARCASCEQAHQFRPLKGVAPKCTHHCNLASLLISAPRLTASLVAERISSCMSLGVSAMRSKLSGKFKLGLQLIRTARASHQCCCFTMSNVLLFVCQRADYLCVCELLALRCFGSACKTPSECRERSVLCFHQTVFHS